MSDARSTTCEVCEDLPGPHCADTLCRECNECGASSGAPCEPFCTAPFGPGGPLERKDA